MKQKKKRILLSNLISKETLYDFLVVKGMKQKEVAQMFNVVSSGISQLAKRYGIKIPVKEDLFTPEELNELYHEKGMSLIEIGKLKGCNEVTVLNWMKRLGIERRSKKESMYLLSTKIHESKGKDLSKKCLEDLYIHQRLSQKQIGSIVGEDGSQISRLLRMYGIPVRSISEGKYNQYELNPPVNVEFFQTPSPDLMYILGYWATDGACTDYGLMRLSLTDKEVIDWTAQTIGYNQKIDVRQPSRNENWKPLYTIRFTNHEVYKIMQEYGIVPNKTHTLTFPKKIPDDLMHHFIRGVFDGDGAITRSSTKQFHKKTGVTKTYYSPQINICGCSKEFMEGVKRVIDSVVEADIKLKIDDRPDKYKNGAVNYSYRLTGMKRVRQFAEWIYEGDYFALTRKKQKIMEYLNQIDDDEISKAT